MSYHKIKRFRARYKRYLSEKTIPATYVLYKYRGNHCGAARYMMCLEKRGWGSLERDSVWYFSAVKHAKAYVCRNYTYDVAARISANMAGSCL